MSTSKAVRTAIRKLPRGRPFTGARFLKYGTRGAVDRTLSRLATDGEIRRVAHGVFVRPKASRFAEIVMPDIHKVVETIAHRNGETIQIHGAEAARRFGLTTQIPTAPVFHTSASSRTIRLGAIAVRMVHTSNRRRLQFAGEPTGVALSALWYLGKSNVTPTTIAIIKAALRPTEFEKLRSADLPAWMQKAFAGNARETVLS